MNEEFLNAGFSVIGTEESENKLLGFLKANYPSVIKGNEIDMSEFRSVIGLPVDERVNGYGLNFVGRNFARAKYAQKTQKELRLNTDLSKGLYHTHTHTHTAQSEAGTQNLILKGDNLDSLKILKNYYNGKIKCIYIDPPYNTANDEFIYPDKFDKEEAEVLGFQNLSVEDFVRMDFSFKTKKSHNGWLSFMYPRLLLARDLLSSDGVIFISIDDNEQANLKLLCDDVFGEENFVGCVSWHKNYASANDSKTFSSVIDYILVFSKSNKFSRNLLPRTTKQNILYKYDSNDGKGKWRSDNLSVRTYSANYDYPITNPNTGKSYSPPSGRSWMTNKETIQKWIDEGRIFFGQNEQGAPQLKRYLNEVQDGVVPTTYWSYDDCGHNDEARKEIKELFGEPPFDSPKPTRLIKQILNIGSSSHSQLEIPNSPSIILDFFAGSGTTGHAVMQLNAEDGGSRKFILCQIDEPIDKKKEAYKFCLENNLPPVISSITIERLRRAGEKIAKEIEEENGKSGLFAENKKQIPDIGFKVFDSVDAPKLEIEDAGKIIFPLLNDDALSRIYNMIFTVGLDEPTQVPQEVVKDCVYKIGKNYYITNSDKITSDDFANAIKDASAGSATGKVFIDGWTASINATLQHYKEDVKIVF